MFWLVLIFGTIITISMGLMTLVSLAYYHNTLEVNEAQKKVYESYENLIENQQNISNNPFNRH